MVELENGAAVTATSRKPRGISPKIKKNKVSVSGCRLVKRGITLILFFFLVSVFVNGQSPSSVETPL